MGKFIIRLLNLCAICGIIVGYNQIVTARAIQEEKQYEQVRSELGEDKKIYRDGVYIGQADGFGGIIRVSVSVEEGLISEIEIVSANNEDSAYLDSAKSIINEIIKNQTSEVDTISGATYSSSGIKNAVANALEEAFLYEEEK